MAESVRIGIIGAGGFTKRNLLPRMLAVPGVQLVAVANRSLESSQKVAEEFEIPNAYGDWRELLANEDMDAVFVGTQPYFHAEAAIAALGAGKHVLCQTRMATSVDDARAMLRKAEETGLKAMLVPSGSYLKGRRYVKHLLDTGYVGELRQVFSHYLVPNYADGDAPMHRRQDHRYFGAINPLHLGIDWDVLRPWFGDPERVFAWGKSFVAQRTDEQDGSPVPVEMPDAITVIAEMPQGAVVTCMQSGVAHFSDERIEIFGDEGTLVYSRQHGLRGGRDGDKELADMPIPDEHADSWRAEEEFVSLVRGEIAEPPGGITFEDGVKNIEFLDAANRSLMGRTWVDLPLP
jgi:predicted dehydrogenase